MLPPAAIAISKPFVTFQTLLRQARPLRFNELQSILLVLRLQFGNLVQQRAWKKMTRPTLTICLWCPAKGNYQVV
jgi:hypothetical protein